MKQKALILAVITTLLWSGSYIVNKLAFQDGVGPLTLSGMRYLIAAIFLLCLGLGKHTSSTNPLPLRMLVLLGVLGFAAAQGLQYVGQLYLTPTQSSLLLSVGNISLVMLVDKLWVRETQTKSDLIKPLILLGGIMLYFYPWGSAERSWIGIAFMLLSSVGYALHMTLTRYLLVKRQVRFHAVVARPMLIGGAVLLGCGLAIEGVPVLTPKLLLILSYLSLASGALGFYLWTWSQKELTAFESSSINNLMLIEIALMDFLFFQRKFSLLQIFAILLVFIAFIAIQRRKSAPKASVSAK